MFVCVCSVLLVLVDFLVCMLVGFCNLLASEIAPFSRFMGLFVGWGFGLACRCCFRVVAGCCLSLGGDGCVGL